MNNDLIKIDSTAIEVAKNLYLAQKMVMQAAMDYSEAYSDFLQHYIGNAEEASSIYINGLLAKLNVLAKFYGDSAYILEELYKDIEELERNTANKLK